MYNGSGGTNLHCIVGGAFEVHSQSKYANTIASSTGSADVGAKLNASNSSSVYTSSGKVQPLGLSLNYVIKL